MEVDLSNRKGMAQDRASLSTSRPERPTTSLVRFAHSVGGGALGPRGAQTTPGLGYDVCANFAIDALLVFSKIQLTCQGQLTLSLSFVLSTL